jgi:hypothetical protein
LARYDRDVAAVLFEPMDAYLRSLATRPGTRDEFTPSVMVAEACIDPRAAVPLLESLRSPAEFSVVNPVHDSRIKLAELLGLSAEDRWPRLWRSMYGQIALDD